MLATSAFPSIDGPAHLAVAHIMTSLLVEPASQFARLYSLDLGIYPTWLCYALLMGLQQLLPPLAAEKALLVALVAAFWLALRYAMPASVTGPATLLTMPVLCSPTLFLGFYGYQLGLVVVVATVGFYFRHGGQFRLGPLIAGMALFCLAYLTHLTAVAFAGFALGLLSLGRFLADFHETGFAAAWRPFAGRLAWIATIASPALLAVLLFAVPRLGGFGEEMPVPFDGSRPERLRLLLSGAWLSATPNYVAYVGLAWVTAVFVALVLGWRRLRLVSLWPFLLLVGGLLALYLAVPYQLGMRWMPERIAVYFYAALGLLAGAMLAVDAGDGRRRLLGLIVTVGAMLALGLGTFARLDTARRLAPYYDEALAAVGRLEAGQSVLALRLVDPTADRYHRQAAAMLIQGGGYGVVLAGSLDVKLYQAGAELFPVRFKATADPYARWSGDADLTAAVPRPDLDGFEARLGYPLDRIVLFGADALTRWPEARALAQRLARGYEPVYESAPSGFARVYARRGGAP